MAERARLPSRNQDGWGLAYYQGRDVAHYRDTTSADQNPLVDWLQLYGPASKTVIGYIRHSTQGDITLANTGPFLRELNGRIHTFVHNGNLRCSKTFQPLQRGRFQPVGETDSELAFCELLQKIATLSIAKDGLATLDARMQVLADMARKFRGCGPYNFFYSDGDTLFVHADQRLQDASGVISPPALHLLECSAHEMPSLIDNVELPIAPEKQKVILLATVPLSDAPWQPMERGQLLALQDGVIVSKVSI